MNPSILQRLIYKLRQLNTRSKTQFPGSEEYWKQRYKARGNSGAGSYNELAEFKAEVLNQFVEERKIHSVIEYGSGDGNQLKLAKYPHYIGFDVSPEALLICDSTFGNDSTKAFRLVSQYTGEKAQLTLSLDVIYHLVEDMVFHQYMDRLFDSSEEYVIVYASNTNEQPPNQSAHVRHRRFTDWVATNKSAWKLLKHIPNKYPYSGDDRTGSSADFFLYERAGR